MALDFPSPPYDGQIYVDPTSNSKYIYVASKSIWKSIQHIPVTTAYGFDKANSAYLNANAAYDMANAAYNSQNVDYTLSNSAFAHANAAYNFSNSAYASINSNWTVQNTLYTVANAAFSVANAALPNVSNAVFEGNLRVTGVLQVGSNTITITNNHIIANDYYRMNTGGHMVAVTDGNIVNAVFDLVNVSFNTANASYASANNVGPQIAPTYNTANAAYNTSNASFGVANAAYAAANNVGPQIAPAFNTANAAYEQSNTNTTTIASAYGKANTALQNTNVTLAGNLTVAGNVDSSLSTGYDRIPVGTINQRPSSPATGMIRFNSTYNVIEVYNGTYWYDVVSGGVVLDGSTSALAAPSAWDIKKVTGTNTNGLYYINLPTVGVQQVYCIMDSSYAGGGWMLALKATRGTTFNYGSSYWTNINTLNPSDLTLNDGDAKYDVFNYYKATDIMARWPDIGAGGSIPNVGVYTWLEKSFHNDNKSSLVDFFANVSTFYKGLGKNFSGWGGQNGVFSSQSGYQWYGFNYNANGSYRVRWGFGWNNENDAGSNDVSGGIGMDRNSWSAGDYISSAQDYSGMNRSARVELWVR